MECAACARGNAGCGTCPGGSDGQAHQCRFSKRCLDAAGQHHDTGARRGYDLIDTARDRAAGRKCVIVLTTFDAGDVAHACGGKKAAGAETRPPGRAGFDRANDRCSCRPRSLE